MTPEILYRDICRGFSEINWNGPVFIKHPDTFDANELSAVYDEALIRAKTLGLKTEAELTQELILAGKWTRLKEKSISSCDEDIAQMELSKKKIVAQSQIDQIYDAILELKKKKSDLLNAKYAYFTVSAESYANMAYRDRQMFLTSFRDKALTKPAFDEEFEYIENFNELSSLFYVFDFGADNIKKICVSHFFSNLFNISTNLYDFFGKPLWTLTQNQSNLIRYAQTYAKVAHEINDLPPEYEGNADKILMWYFLRQNAGSTGDQEKQAQDALNAKLRATVAETS